jgi:hypothetical protein
VRLKLNEKPPLHIDTTSFRRCMHSKPNSINNLSLNFVANLFVYVLLKWQGDMAVGFVSSQDAPSLTVSAEDGLGGWVVPETGVMEAQSMTGTDESV